MIRVNILLKPADEKRFRKICKTLKIKIMPAVRSALLAFIERQELLLRRFDDTESD